MGPDTDIVDKPDGVGDGDGDLPVGDEVNDDEDGDQGDIEVKDGDE